MKDGGMTSQMSWSSKGSHYIIHKSILEHSLNFFKHLSERVKLINNINLVTYPILCDF